MLIFGLSLKADVHLRKVTESLGLKHCPVKVVPPAVAAMAVIAVEERRPTRVLSDIASGFRIGRVLVNPRAENQVLDLGLVVAYLDKFGDASDLEQAAKVETPSLDWAYLTSDGPAGFAWPAPALLLAGELV